MSHWRKLTPGICRRSRCRELFVLLTNSLSSLVMSRHKMIFFECEPRIGDIRCHPTKHRLHLIETRFSPVCVRRSHNHGQVQFMDGVFQLRDKL